MLRLFHARCAPADRSELPGPAPPSLRLWLTEPPEQPPRQPDSWLGAGVRYRRPPPFPASWAPTTAGHVRARLDSLAGTTDPLTRTVGVASIAYVVRAASPWCTLLDKISDACAYAACVRGRLWLCIRGGHGVKIASPSLSSASFHIGVPGRSAAGLSLGTAPEGTRISGDPALRGGVAAVRSRRRPAGSRANGASARRLVLPGRAQVPNRPTWTSEGLRNGSQMRGAARRFRQLVSILKVALAS